MNFVREVYRSNDDLAGDDPGVWERGRRFPGNPESVFRLSWTFTKLFVAQRYWHDTAVFSGHLGERKAYSMKNTSTAHRAQTK